MESEGVGSTGSFVVLSSVSLVVLLGWVILSLAKASLSLSMVMIVGERLSVRSLLLCLLLFFLCFLCFLWCRLLLSCPLSSPTSSTLRLVLVFLDLSLDFLWRFSLLLFLCFVNTSDSASAGELGSLLLDVSSRCLVLYFLLPPGLLW